MLKKILSAIIPMAFGILFLSSCSTLKSLDLFNRKQNALVTAAPQATKFITDITVTPQIPVDNSEVKSGPKMSFTTGGLNVEETQEKTEDTKNFTDIVAVRKSIVVENASSVQIKYAGLLKTELESLPNKTLLEGVDKWYGVRYVYGGNGKNGIDCSGFTCNVYSEVYGISLPRVSRDQYNISRKISTTELMEGDLLFFNTLGNGVSHVAIYLGNNRFIHSTVSKGVMVNSLFDSYYVKRFVGAGRIDKKQIVAAN